MPDPNPRRTRIKNLTLAGIAGQAGCWVILMVIGALLLGLWVDAQLGLRGPFTIGIVVLSIPVTMFVVFRIVLRLIAAIQPPTPDEHDNDTSNRGG